MRLFTATIIANTEIRPGVHLITMHAPQLVQAVQPGHYCMVRCCDPLATDPLLRRPFFVQSVQRNLGHCTLLVHVRGRGTAWLVKQSAGALLDLLGPLGHGWVIHPTVRNLLLLNEGPNITALTLLAQYAVEQELSVTLISHVASADDAYPPALLPPEVEYRSINGDPSPAPSPRAPARDAPTIDGSRDEQSVRGMVGASLAGALGDGGGTGAGAGAGAGGGTGLGVYLDWADAAFLCVSHETSVALYSSYERLRSKNFAQCAVIQPFVCASGACLTCSIETRSGPRLVCRAGPVFDLREIAR